MTTQDEEKRLRVVREKNLNLWRAQEEEKFRSKRPIAPACGKQ
jgi:hypothetical protein